MKRSISFIGAGRLGSTLAVAMHRAGLPVTMIASRTQRSAEQVASLIAGCRVVDEQEAASADMVFLTVPDDDIAAVANRLNWHDGQFVVHCSGATEVSVLQHAASSGAQTGGFHPIQIFAGVEQSLGLLPGTTVGIEAPAVLLEQLRHIAVTLGMVPMVLPAGVRARYHGGSLFMSSFLLSMFKESAQIWQTFGMTEQQTLAALLPLARGVIETAQQKGLAEAIAGPISRGDTRVIQQHIAAFDAIDAGHTAFYREMSRRQLLLAAEGTKVTPVQLASLHAIIDAYSQHWKDGA